MLAMTFPSALRRGKSIFAKTYDVIAVSKKRLNTPPKIGLGVLHRSDISG
jgi:hypothetical protein